MDRLGCTQPAQPIPAELAKIQIIYGQLKLLSNTQSIHHRSQYPPYESPYPPLVPDPSQSSIVPC